MYCPHCMKEIRKEASVCPFCAQPTHTPIAGMATLRISCAPRRPLLMIILSPLFYFIGYKVHIYVDEQHYVLKSKKKQIDIPVSIGTHLVRISSVSKTSAKVMKFFGSATAFIGAVTGSRATLYTGAVIEDAGGAFSDDGVFVDFEPNKLLTLSVKLAWNGSIVEDNKNEFAKRF